MGQKRLHVPATLKSEKCGLRKEGRTQKLANFPANERSFVSILAFLLQKYTKNKNRFVFFFKQVKSHLSFQTLLLCLQGYLQITHANHAHKQASTQANLRTHTRSPTPPHTYTHTDTRARTHGHTEAHAHTHTHRCTRSRTGARAHAQVYTLTKRRAHAHAQRYAHAQAHIRRCARRQPH